MISVDRFTVRRGNDAGVGRFKPLRTERTELQEEQANEIGLHLFFGSLRWVVSQTCGNKLSWAKMSKCISFLTFDTQLG